MESFITSSCTLSSMFIAIIGTRFSGKTSIEDYLVASKSFTCVRLRRDTTKENSISSQVHVISLFIRFLAERISRIYMLKVGF